ncbi:hypothetical protein K469DRAFT_458952, partial [Zopfia rhizophila CBS 207.26]
ISARDYIYFLPHPLPDGTPIPYTTGLPTTNPLNLSPILTEPTSTLVLTSPSQIFIDIRILKPIFSSDELLPNTGGPAYRLEWGFAGRSTSAPIPRQETKGVKHSIWEHWVDSRWSIGSPEIPVDEGDLYPISSTQTLEFGTMFNPTVSAIHNYEEMWSDIEVQRCGTETKKWCVVLMVNDAANGVRGMVIRLGQYCQGLLKKGDSVTVERWEYVEKEKDGMDVNGDWERVVRLGDSFVPCAVTFNPEKITPGSEVTYGNYEWVVEELVDW